MRLSQQQFTVFKKICSKLNIRIDQVSLNHLKFPKRNRKTTLRTKLIESSNRFSFTLRHNQLHHGNFWFDKGRLKRARKRYRSRKQFDKAPPRLESKSGIAPSPANIEETETNQEFTIVEDTKICEVSKRNVNMEAVHIENSAMEYAIDCTSELNDNEDLFEVIPETDLVSNIKIEVEESSIMDVTIVDRLLNKMNTGDQASSMTYSNIPVKNEEAEQHSGFTIKYVEQENPRQMQTPLVENRRRASAFLCEENEDAFAEKEKLANIKMISNSPLDDSRMRSKSKLPAMNRPVRPLFMEKAKTVLDKRKIFSQGDIPQLMVEQEGMIYHQIQRRSNKHEVNYEMLNTLLHISIPMNCDSWRALTWLRTTEGNYIWKNAVVDDYNLKINGSIGNHKTKFLEKQTSKPFPKYKMKCTGKICRPRIGDKLRRALVKNKRLQNAILSYEDDDIHENSKKSLLDKKLENIPPGPLSRKLIQLNFLDNSQKSKKDDDEIYLGAYKVFKMPKVSLEISVQQNKPVDPFVNQYLKAIIPHRRMDESWLEFSLSTLRSNSKIAPKEHKTERRRFSFNIPYENNKNTVVVREIKKKNHNVDFARQSVANPDKKTDILNEDIEWTFDKNADPDSQLDREIVEIIKDLTNSTAINLNHDIYNRGLDPTFERQNDKIDIISQPNTKIISSPETKSANKKQKRLVHELRRLNCTVVRAGAAEEENSLSNDTRCLKEFCAKGCICDENSNHSMEKEREKQTLSYDKMELLHKKATASLAKVEKTFTSTVILTDSNPLLVQNTTVDKRRSKRAPKKFNDYFYADEAIELSKRKNISAPQPTKTVHQQPMGNVERKYSILNIEEKSKSDNEDRHKKKLLIMSHFTEQRRKQQKVKPNYVYVPGGGLAIKSKMDKGLDRMLHVGVDLVKLEFDWDEIQPFCMVHQLYKCMCKLKSTQGHPFQYDKQYKDESSNRRRKVDSSDDDSRKKFRTDTPLIIDDKSSDLQIQECISLDPLQESRVSRCAPVQTSFYKDKNKNGILFRNYYGQRRIEILNINELVNEGKGPIYINIYDCELNRLNSVMRSIILNDNALIYIDGNAYYVDKSSGLEIPKINFKRIMHDIEHPIFILQKKKNCIMRNEGQYLGTRDFIKLMHEDNFIVVEKNKKTLKEICCIIDNVLRSVRNKVKKKTENIQLGEGIKEQLEKITRQRKSSCSSMSSASSPFYLHPTEDAIRAKETSSGGGDVKEFNDLFTKRIQQFLTILRSNQIGLEPSENLVNKFFIYRWEILIKSFNLELSEIWLVTKYDANGSPHSMMVLTKSNLKPPVEDVEKKDIVNIRSFDPFNPNIPNLAKLILLGIQNQNTRNMVILLFGCEGYFRICGVLNSPLDYTKCGFVARPNPKNHPELTNKIMMVFKAWKAMKEKAAAAAGQVSGEVNVEQNMREAPRPNYNQSFSMPAGPSKPRKRQTQPSTSQQQIPESSHLIQPKASDLEVQKNKQQFSQFKWFAVICIADDFSDLFIKEWRSYLSYTKMSEFISNAKSRNQCLRMKPSKRACSSMVMAIPKKLECLKYTDYCDYENFILVGPFNRRSDAGISLFQNLDGVLVSRDYYIEVKGIESKEPTTIDLLLLDYLAVKNEITHKTPHVQSTPSTLIPPVPPLPSTSKAFNTPKKPKTLQYGRPVYVPNPFHSKFVALDSMQSSGQITVNKSNSSIVNRRMLTPQSAGIPAAASTFVPIMMPSTDSHMDLKISSIISNYKDYQNNHSEDDEENQFNLDSSSPEEHSLENGGFGNDLIQYKNQPWGNVLDLQVMKSDDECEEDDYQ